MAYSRTAYETAYCVEKTAKSGYDINLRAEKSSGQSHYSCHSSYAPDKHVRFWQIHKATPAVLLHGQKRFLLQEITGNYKRLLDTTRDYWKLREITGHYKRLLEIMGRFLAIGRSQIMTPAFSLSKANACDCSKIPPLTHISERFSSPSHECLKRTLWARPYPQIRQNIYCHQWKDEWVFSFFVKIATIVKPITRDCPPHKRRPLICTETEAGPHSNASHVRQIRFKAPNLNWLWQAQVGGA